MPTQHCNLVDDCTQSLVDKGAARDYGALCGDSCNASLATEKDH